MSDLPGDPFRPALRLTNAEWTALEAFRQEQTVQGAAHELGVPEKQLRLVLINVAEKLRLATSV